MTPGALDLFEMEGGKPLVEWLRGSQVPAFILHVAATTTERRDIHSVRSGFSLVSSHDVMGDSRSMTIDAGHSGRQVNIFVVEPARVFRVLQGCGGVARQTGTGTGVCEQLEFDATIATESGSVVVAIVIDESSSDERNWRGVARIEMFDALGEIVSACEMTYETVGSRLGGACVTPGIMATEDAAPICRNDAKILGLV